MKIYVASKAKHWWIWQALRAAGLPITSAWIDAPFNMGGSRPSADQWARHWRACLQQAADCDVLLFLALEGENQCGALAEMGAAPTAGRLVFIASPHWWSLQHHPRVRKFYTLAEAIAALLEMQAAGATPGPPVAAARRLPGSENRHKNLPAAASR